MFNKPSPKGRGLISKAAAAIIGMALMLGSAAPAVAVPVVGVGGGSGSVVSGSGGSDANEGLNTATECAASGSNGVTPQTSVASIDFFVGKNYLTASSAAIPSNGYPDVVATTSQNIGYGLYCGNTRVAINRGSGAGAMNGLVSLFFTLNKDYYVFFNAGNGSDEYGRTHAFKVSAGTSCTADLIFRYDGSTASSIRRQETVSCGGGSLNSDDYGTNVPGIGMYIVEDNPDPTAPPTPLPRDHTSRLMYDANGGSGAPQGQSKTVSDTSDTGEIDFTVSYTKPTWSGHTFLGWSEDEYATDASYSGGDSIGVPYDSSTTLYAVWKENPKPTARAVLAYDANGGSGAPQGQQATGPQGDSKTWTVSSKKPTWAGHTFVQWMDDEGNTYSGGDQVTVDYGSTVTLHAQWEEDAPAQKTATLKYDTDGGTPATIQPQTETGPEGDNATFTVANNPTKTGFTFTGWQSDKDGSTVQGGDQIDVPYGDTVTLTAQWQKTAPAQKTATLKYDTDGGTPATIQPQTETGPEGDNATFTVADAPTKTGFTFAGWKSDKDGSTKNAGGSIDVAYGDTVTLTAQWTKNPDPNTPPVIDGVKDQTINKGDPFDPKKDVTATDKEDGNLTDKIVITGTVDTSKPGKYELTYTVTDSGKPDGKPLSDTKHATITVVDPNTPPTIDGTKDHEIPMGGTFDPKKDVTATDKEDGNLTDKIVITGTVDTSKPGKYELTYTVTDSGGLTDTKKITVTVTNTPPVINGTKDQTLNYGDTFDPMKGVTGTDKEDGDVTGKIQVQGTVDTSKPGKYELTFTVTDKGGLTDTKKETITVLPKVLGKLPQTGASLGLVLTGLAGLAAVAAFGMFLIGRRSRVE